MPVLIAFRTLAVILLSSLALPNFLHAQSNDFSYFESGIRAMMKKRRLPSLSVAISRNDTIVYAKAFGYADIEKKIQATPQTAYHVASITKPIAATVMMQLVEEKKLDLNWTIRDHYPDYENTMRRILTYFRSDMPAYTFLLENYHPERKDITLLHHLTHTAEGVPGEAYKYNGFLYGNLSRAITFVTGYNFDSLITTRIIDRLGMKNSMGQQLDSTSRRGVYDRLAKPYRLDSNRNLVRSEYQNLDLNAGAGFISTPSDILLFDKAIDLNTLVSAGDKRFMWETPVLKDGTHSPYGKGWFVQPDVNLNDTLIWHYGLQNGSFSGIYLKVPGHQNMSLVLLSNSDGLTATDELGKGDILVSPFVELFLNECLGRK